MLARYVCIVIMHFIYFSVLSAIFRAYVGQLGDMFLKVNTIVIHKNGQILYSHFKLHFLDISLHMLQISSLKRVKK